MELGNYIIKLLGKENIDGKTKHKFENKYKRFTFNITVVDKGKYSYLFDSIRIGNTEDHPRLNSGELERRGFNLCEKVTYLMDDLDVIEIDSSSGLVLLRSRLNNNESPKQVINYFEMTLNCDRVIIVKRYSHNRQTRVKESQSFNLTTDIAEKFIDHLIETVA